MRYPCVPGTLSALVIACALSPMLATGPARGAPQTLTPREAVRRAVESNLGLKAARLATDLSEANERAAEASFDTRVVAGIDVGGSVLQMALPRFDIPLRSTLDLEGSVGLQKRFSTGTILGARLAGFFQFDSEDHLDGSVTTGTFALTLNQPLLRGVSSLANRVAITTARLARQAAEHRLRRQAELLASKVLKAYWDLHDALARARIQRVALGQAKTTVTETEGLIQGQKVAAAELVVARHQVAIQERAVLLADQTVENTRDTLARLMGSVGPRSLETPVFQTQEPAPFTGLTGTLETLQKEAYRQRGDYLALGIEAQAHGVRVDASRHQLLPKLDLVGGVSVGPRRSLIGATATEPSSTGWFNWAVGLAFEYPLGNREARAEVELSELRSQQARVSILEQEQAISEELKLAWRGVRAAQALVKVTTAAVQVAETKLSNEMDKYRAGKSSGQILQIVQTDLIQERLSLQQARATLQKALVDLHTSAGALLKNAR